MNLLAVWEVSGSTPRRQTLECYLRLLCLALVTKSEVRGNAVAHKQVQLITMQIRTFLKLYKSKIQICFLYKPFNYKRYYFCATYEHNFPCFLQSIAENINK